MSDSSCGSGGKTYFIGDNVNLLSAVAHKIEWIDIQLGKVGLAAQTVKISDLHSLQSRTFAVGDIVATLYPEMRCARVVRCDMPSSFLNDVHTAMADGSLESFESRMLRKATAQECDAFLAAERCCKLGKQQEMVAQVQTLVECVEMVTDPECKDAMRKSLLEAFQKLIN